MTPNTQTADAKPDPRTTILAAAEECFARFGIAKTTMEDVARASAVSRATVYRHFADREALIVESVVRRARSRMDDTRERIRALPTVEERIVDGLCANIRRGGRDPMVGRLASPGEMQLWVDLLQSTGKSVELTYELWGPVLAEEQAAGTLRADLDVHLVCEWFAELETMYITSNPSEEDLDRIRLKLRTFVLPALLAR